MQVSTNALVLKARDVNEADKVLTLLSSDLGVITAFANGSKKLKSKLSTVSNAFCYARFNLYKKRDAYVIDNAEPIELFYKIRQDIENLSLASYFAELSQSLAPNGDRAEPFLRLILNSLHFLDKNLKTREFLKPLFELKIISLAGFMPNLICCADCGCYENDRMFFHIRNGEIYCEACHKPPSDNAPVVMLSRGVLTAMRHIIYSDFEKLFSFTLPDEALKWLGVATESYLINHTERSFKSLEFYKSICI
ncbi:MAG: DNA repair protein RecO [Oscillospiraceae bacterium]|nr:DNA repair protein RecO [Oscillospiraceae bacterium]